MEEEWLGANRKGGASRNTGKGCQGTAHRVLGVNAGNTRRGSGARPGGLGAPCPGVPMGACTHGSAGESGSRDESLEGFNFSEFQSLPL